MPRVSLKYPTVRSILEKYLPQIHDPRAILFIRGYPHGSGLVFHRESKKCRIWVNLNYSDWGISSLLTQWLTVNRPRGEMKCPILNNPLFNHHWNGWMFSGNCRLWKRWDSGWNSDVRAGLECSVSHKAMECERVGHKMDSLLLQGHQRRKSMVCPGIDCLSMLTQSRLFPLAYSMEIWASWAAW